MRRSCFTGNSRLKEFADNRIYFFLREQEPVFWRIMQNKCLKTRYLFEMTDYFKQPVKRKFHVLIMTLTREQVLGRERCNYPVGMSVRL